MAIIEVTQLTKIYGSGDTAVKALDGVNLSIDAGKLVAVMGPSGCGKSTLLHLIGGLDRPTSGVVLIEGRDISRMKDDELTKLRRQKMGFIFQFFNRIPVLNAVIPDTPMTRLMHPEYIGRNTSRLGLCDMQFLHFVDAADAMGFDPEGAIRADTFVAVMTPPDAEGLDDRVPCCRRCGRRDTSWWRSPTSRMWPAAGRRDRFHETAQYDTRRLAYGRRAGYDGSRK